MLVSLVRRMLPPRIRRVLKRFCQLQKTQSPGGYEILTGPVADELLNGFKQDSVAALQEATFSPILEQLREGKPREDFVALAKAIEFTRISHPSIVEVGCGNGWNWEVLTRLYARPFDFLGLDYSAAMVSQARLKYPEAAFVVADATALPFRDSAFDILISGTVLMHLLDYRAAIRESRRVARAWCIFHTVPILRRRSTTVLQKQAYGQAVVEVAFNEAEFCNLLEGNGFIVRKVLPSLPYDLCQVVGEHTVTRTYICEVAG
jgi:SAM-dependent methyltransferase